MSEMITEISRRAMSRQEEGFCCGMSDIITVDAEIEARYNGSPVFFHAQWSDAMGAVIQFEATGKSVYELWEKLKCDESYFGDILDECRIRQEDVVEPGPELPDGFTAQYDALKEMIKDELRRNGIAPAVYKAFRT